MYTTSPSGDRTAHEREDSLWGWGPCTIKYHVLHCVQGGVKHVLCLPYDRFFVSR